MKHLLDEAVVVDIEAVEAEVVAVVIVVVVLVVVVLVVVVLVWVDQAQDLERWFFVAEVVLYRDQLQEVPVEAATMEWDQLQQGNKNVIIQGHFLKLHDFKIE